MHKKNLLRSNLLSLFMVCSLISCGGTGDNGGDGKTSGGNGGDNTSDSGTNTGLDGLADDLTLDDEGNVSFDEQVDIDVWCIIGDPDQKTFASLVTEFNNEYQGMIHLNMTYIGHYDYYNNLETAYANDWDSFPEMCIMHNEKTAQYAASGYLLPLDEINKKTKVEVNYDTVYENIDRVTKYNGVRYAVPMDAHGFVTSIRQDIIKKNELGFDGNTRFIPNSRKEYQDLLTGLREKADAGELWIRNINKGADHSWTKADPDSFYPEYTQSTDPDGLSALYANGGSMASSDGKTITFQNNEGFVTYITDQVTRYNNREMGDSAGTNTEGFGTGSYVLFPEGPWWVSQQYTLAYNNSELKKEGNGVTAEDAADPIMNTPYTASRPDGWWTLDENANTENGSKWYGNGHAISLTKKITSSQKAAAALTFINWLTHGKDEDTGIYHLATWCNSGHIPAYKEVYDSEGYQNYMEKNLTLKALGDPANIIAMEGLGKEVTIFNALANAVSLVQGELKTKSGCDKDKAIELINKAASDGQEALDLLDLM